MSIKAPISILGCLYLISLVACGGGGSSGDPQAQDDPAAVNQAPTVQLGEDLTVKVGDLITVDSTASDDGQPNASLTYFWEQVSGPDNVRFGSPNKDSTTLVFDTVGIYVIRLTVHDGALTANDSISVTVTTSIVSPNDQIPSSGVKEHNSGLRLEFDPNSVLANSTDIDWMHRLWLGMVSCQGGSAVPFPTIRLVETLSPSRQGDMFYDDGEAGYKWNYDQQDIEVLNADTAIQKGSDQGLVLGEAISVYLGFYEDDGFPDPGSRGSYNCHRWHAGGRWNPSPAPVEFNQPPFVHELEYSLGDASISIKSDTARVDPFTLGWVGELYRRLYQCHGGSSGTNTVIKEILVVSERANDFHGDQWSETGSYRVADGGRILIDSQDLINIRNNDQWGTILYDWINQYLDASRNTPFSNFECADKSGIFFAPILPFDLNE